MKVTFNDGVSFDMSGLYRIERRRDGLYVVGQGMLCPVPNEAEGRELIASLRFGKQEEEDKR